MYQAFSESPQRLKKTKTKISQTQISQPHRLPSQLYMFSIAGDTKRGSQFVSEQKGWGDWNENVYGTQRKSLVSFSGTCIAMLWDWDQSKEGFRHHDEVTDNIHCSDSAFREILCFSAFFIIKEGEAQKSISCKFNIFVKSGVCCSIYLNYPYILIKETLF